MNKGEMDNKHIQKINKILHKVLWITIVFHLIYILMGQFITLNSIRVIYLTIVNVVCIFCNKRAYYKATKYINIFGIMIFSLTYYDKMIISLYHYGL